MRAAVLLAYDGTGMAGWQRQPGDISTIQLALESSLEKIFGERIAVTGAGRTDAGVHARGQVCSFDIPRHMDMERLRIAIDSNTPANILPRKITLVDDTFSARRSAIWREYIYFIHNSPNRPVFYSRYCHWIKSPLDVKSMNEAAAYIIGSKDFGSFCRLSERPENTTRNIMKACFCKKRNIVYFRIRASSFLTNMVRIIVGSLIEIGKGSKKIDWIKNLIESSNRTEAGGTAPPEGLFLWRVGYPQIVFNGDDSLI